MYWSSWSDEILLGKGDLVKEVSISGFFQTILQKWWVVVLCTFLGGGGGTLFHAWQPPVYEVKAALAVNLDVLEYQLTLWEEDRLMSAILVVVNSRQVHEQTISQANALWGYSLTVEEFRQKISLERQFWVVEMRLRDHDPTLATELVNLWAETAYYTLTQAQKHALAAYQIQRQLDGWLACLPGYVTPTPGPAAPQTSLIPAWNENCKNYSPEVIEAAIARLSAARLAEQNKSLGLAPFIEFSFPEKASIPDRPVVYGRGILVLAGGIIGFLLAVWALAFWSRRA